MNFEQKPETKEKQLSEKIELFLENLPKAKAIALSIALFSGLTAEAQHFTHVRPKPPQQGQGFRGYNGGVYYNDYPNTYYQTNNNLPSQSSTESPYEKNLNFKDNQYSLSPEDLKKAFELHNTNLSKLYNGNEETELLDDLLRHKVNNFLNQDNQDGNTKLAEYIQIIRNLTEIRTGSKTAEEYISVSIQKIVKEGHVVTLKSQLNEILKNKQQ